MQREIKKFPDPILHKVASPVEQITDGIRILMRDMAETMYAADGVGIAAPQVGVGLRIACVDITGCDGDTGLGLLKLINPEIISKEGEIEYEEGCLSVPTFYHKMKRARSLVVRYLDENGKNRELAAEGLLAIVIQQEIDHLDGKLIIDNVSPLKQDMYLKDRQKVKG